MEIIKSIFFVLIFLITVIGILCVKKTDRKLNILTWITISIVTVFCYQVFTAAILNWVGIPINLISISACNAILSIFIFVKCGSVKNYQKYEISIFDIICLVVLLATVCIVFLRQFGLDLKINYETSDPSQHFQFAMDIVNSESVKGMFFAPLNNGMFLSVASNFINATLLYKAYILTESIMLLLSGLMFLACIRKYLNNGIMKISGLIAVLIYVLGYPLNNMVFGFGYLGVGITLIGFIICVTEMYINDEISKRFNVLLMGLGSLGILTCYVLFAPVVLVSTFACVSIYHLNKKSLLKISTFINYFIMYLIPCIIGFIYIFFDVFFSTGTSVSGAINLEGYIYKDLFSNFILYLPVCLFGIFTLFRNRSHNLVKYMLPILTLYMLFLLYRGLGGHVSSYYYYKNYYFMWLLAMYLFVYGLSIIYKKDALLTIAVMICILILFAINIFNVEKKISEKNALFNSNYVSNSLFNIYNFNMERNVDEGGKLDQNKVDLFSWVAENLTSKGEKIPVVGEWLDYYWFEGISNQRHDEIYPWIMGNYNFFEYIKNDNSVRYLLVLTDSTYYLENQNYYESLTKIYENEKGYVVRIK
ncbi:hypothetical protein [Parasporobacterium paucivorans]|uniref:Dolichyl-phosphate-mannose-protein mannosyltransferase n=1 Tax=Parasporobacterium paucivorans DSM 15970 TaxID=1122934 RepID=A0A1M6JUT8_9FIRM|nr:hypothetical protein [Parasporobacterium paucivorans]SHJ50436.1 hypothetical protein SAMN02745691_02074 [Parasporobacterium paucivorans DSM 15970]